MMAVVICTSHSLIFSNQAALAGTVTGTVWAGCFLVFYFSWQVEHFLSEFFKTFPNFFCMTLKSQTVGLLNQKREHFQRPPSNNCSLWWFSWLVPFKPNWANLSFHIMFRFLKRKQFQLRISFSFFMLHQAIEASFCWNSCAENPRPLCFGLKQLKISGVFLGTKRTPCYFLSRSMTFRSSFLIEQCCGYWWAFHLVHRSSIRMSEWTGAWWPGTYLDFHTQVCRQERIPWQCAGSCLCFYKNSWGRGLKQWITSGLHLPFPVVAAVVQQ